MNFISLFIYIYLLNNYVLYNAYSYIRKYILLLLYILYLVSVHLREEKYLYTFAVLWGHLMASCLVNLGSDPMYDLAMDSTHRIYPVKTPTRCMSLVKMVATAPTLPK